MAALISLVQINSARNGRPNAFSAGVTAIADAIGTGIAATFSAVRGVAGGIGELPKLRSQNERLAAENARLRDENASLREALSKQPDLEALSRVSARNPGGVPAQTIGYDPENQSRTVTLNRGTLAGVHLNDGVLGDDGVVGRVVALEPFQSTVLLLTDPTSKIPAVVQRGRWWGIATGTGSSVRLEFVSQDARLRPGDLVETGEGRSFHAGVPIGRIVSISHPEGALYQTALIAPAVALGRLSNALVVPH
jgi:rod shape-determining protein MreC